MSSDRKFFNAWPEFDIMEPVFIDVLNISSNFRLNLVKC